MLVHKHEYLLQAAFDLDTPRELWLPEKSSVKVCRNCLIANILRGRYCWAS